jgi:hypothetical protein
MPFVNVANLGEGKERVPQNLSQAFFNEATQFVDYIKDFELQFFGILNVSVEAEAQIYRWVVPIRYWREFIKLKVFGVSTPSFESLAQQMRFFTFALQEAQNLAASGAISAQLASDLVDAYNNVFS